jgi:hypothetical protein
LRTAEKLGFAVFLHHRQRQMMPGGDKRKSWIGPQSPTAARRDRFSRAAGPIGRSADRLLKDRYPCMDVE